MAGRESVRCDPNRGPDPTTMIDPDQNPDPGSTAVSHIPLKSIQTFQTQDEFLVAMREDLAEWFSGLYDLSIQESNLLAHLSTGVLLCQHANAFNDAMKISKESTSASAPDAVVTSGSGSGSVPATAAVQCSRSAQPGTFHSRVNISNFLSWCRGTLGVRDTLLFETEDLVQARNERNVVLCLLEVARRGARIGMPAPSLVQLEAEIDEEIRRDDVMTAGRHGNGDDVIDTRDVGVQTMTYDDVGGCGGDVTVQALDLRSSSESLCSSESSFRHHLQTTPMKMSQRHHRHHRPPPHSHPHAPSVYHSTPGSTTPTRPVRSKPVIEVDMMSLDEMVRNILNRCTCAFQYPMVRVSEGKYRIGESLTFIFVRILRNHVMVRIGGGWDTLDNYLNRHDPCRMETKVSKTGAHASSRTCAHVSDASSASSAISSPSAADQSDASQAETDDADVNLAGKSEGQDASERISDDLSSVHHHRRHLGFEGQEEDDDDLCREGVRSTSGRSASCFLPSSSASCPASSLAAEDISGTRTRVSPSGKTVVDVACQTTEDAGAQGEEQLTRRYSSSSSGASSLEPTNERLEVNSYRTQEQKREVMSSENTQKYASGRSNVDLISNSTEENKDDCIAGAAPNPTQTPQKKSSHAPLTPGTKTSRTLPNTCQRCGHPISASENRTNCGLCPTCSKQQGTPPDHRASGPNKRYRNERPGSAQEDRRPPLDRPGSAQEKRQRRPADRPGSARGVTVSRALTFSSARVTMRDKEAMGRGTNNNGREALAELKRTSTRQRPASAQERGGHPGPGARILPSPTKQPQTRVLASSEPPAALLPSPRQRPSSAREQRQRGGGPEMRPVGVRRILPKGPSEPDTRSDEEGGGGGKNCDKTKEETAVRLRHRRSFNAHTARLPLVRELSNTTKACDSTIQGKYIPQTGNLSEETQAAIAVVVVADDDDGNDATVKTRPRKDVNRKASITKIPKPVG